jgi:thioesterase domain-containing protein
MMLHKEELEIYLHRNIPLTQAIGIHIESASLQEITLTAPFLNNINHKKTVFGGSLHAVATLACWSLIYMNVVNLKPVEIVITSSTIDYLLPVTSDFKAQCLLPEDSTWKRFLSTLHHKNKARVSLKATIYQDEKLAVDYIGVFAAFKRKS